MYSSSASVTSYAYVTTPRLYHDLAFLESWCFCHVSSIVTACLSQADYDTMMLVGLVNIKKCTGCLCVNQSPCPLFLPKRQEVQHEVQPNRERQPSDRHPQLPKRRGHGRGKNKGRRKERRDTGRPSLESLRAHLERPDSPFVPPPVASKLAYPLLSER